MDIKEKDMDEDLFESMHYLKDYHKITSFIE